MKSDKMIMMIKKMNQLMRSMIISQQIAQSWKNILVLNDKTAN